MPEAIRLYREAAAKGNPLAKARLAIIYYRGIVQAGLFDVTSPVPCIRRGRPSAEQADEGAGR
jgi:TPR repeat protein